MIGEVVDEHRGFVMMRTRVGPESVRFCSTESLCAHIRCLAGVARWLNRWRKFVERLGELFKKRRQFQERVPDSPRQWNADDEPVNEKFEPVIGRLIAQAWKTFSWLSILSAKVIALIHWTDRKVAN